MITNLPGNAGDVGSIPGSAEIPWRRAWQPTPVFLPGESPRTEEPGGLQSMESPRVGHMEHLSKHTFFSLFFKN